MSSSKTSSEQKPLVFTPKLLANNYHWSHSLSALAGFTNEVEAVELGRGTYPPFEQTEKTSIKTKNG